MKKFLILLAMVMLSGCAVGLGPEFLTKAKEDLGMSPIIYSRANWVHAVCGYPSSLGFPSNATYTSGALLVDDEKIGFVEYDKEIQKYKYGLQYKYPDVADVRVFKKGRHRILVLFIGRVSPLDHTINQFTNICYTFEIAKDASIDTAKTYEFAIFIADKSGKDPSEFSKELAKEKESTEQTKKEPIEVHKVNFKTYQISAPYSGKWENETKEDEESVKFENNYTTAVPLGIRQKLIYVFKIPTSKELQYLSKDMVASRFMNQEEKKIIEQYQKNFFLEKKGVTTIGNKRLYFMKYNIDMSHIGWSHYVQEAILHLYVPEDFKDRLAFYGFLYTDLHMASWLLGKIDLEQVHWVINSFQLK